MGAFFVQSVFGILDGIGTHEEDVMHMRRTANRLFGKDYRWSVLGAGKNQMPFCTQAVMMGGNVRVGLEDSVYIGRGKLARNRPTPRPRPPFGPTGERPVLRHREIVPEGESISSVTSVRPAKSGRLGSHAIGTHSEANA